jgi:hypothetical protein
MHKTVGSFWLALAILYLVLAVVSFRYGQHYDRQIAKAPTEQVTETGAKVLETPLGPIVFGGASRQGDVVVADLWKDLRAYLQASTWVNLAGFVLAAAAASVSFLSSRSAAR